MTGCLEPEVLAAYLDHGLSLAERARVETHLASCPHCVAMLAGVARTVADLSAHAPEMDVTAKATSWRTGRAWMPALGAAAAVLVVLLVPTVVRHQEDRDAGLASLVDTVTAPRTVLGRLTGGFPHTPLDGPSAGGQDGRTAEDRRVQLAADRIRESVGERMTPSELHALGVSELLAGRYDDAAMSLLAASREQPANARYLSDVAAVQLERGRRGLRPDDLPRALASADRARRLDPALAEAWFNRGAAFAALSMRDQARASWTEYLKRDSSSPWAREVKQRAAELSKPTPGEQWTQLEGRLQDSFDAAVAAEAVKAHLTESRRLIEIRLLPAWADAASEGRDGSLELERIRVMAGAMQQVVGDALYVDTVNAIDRASRDGKLTTLANAHKQYADAAAVFADDQYARALPLLRQARSSLISAGSPYFVRANLDLASIVYLSGNYAETSQLLSETLAAAQKSQYPYAEARATWIQGLTAFMQGQLGEAQSKYEDTLGAFTRMGDEEQIAAAHTLLAGLFYYLGDDTQAWTHFVPAFRGLEVTRSLKLRHGFLSAAATALRESDPEAALTIQDETVRNAQQWGNAAAISEALAARATILAAIGQTQLGQRDLASARQQMVASNDRAFRSRLEITVLLTESKLLRLTNPSGAADAAQRAIHLVEQRKDNYRLPQLQLELAKANIARGRIAEAEQALLNGIRAFDQEREALVDEGRASARDEAWGLFETAVRLAIHKRDFGRAFELSERARLRSLAEARKLTSLRSLQAIQSTLRANEGLLALNQFDDDLAIWIIRNDRYNVVVRQIPRTVAERLVARQQNEVWQRSASVEASAALFNELIKPVQRDLSKIERLIIVPDSTYENASFAALSDSTSSHFLIEDFTVSVAPSVNAFAAIREGAPLEASSDPLVFGGNAGAAPSETTRVASTYRSATAIMGTAATKSRFFADAQRRPVVHLAAPIAISRSNPLLSRAIVADEAGTPHSGVIYGSDIAKVVLGTQLVVLDDVKDGRSIRGEGVSGMARAFMTAGVPAVVGTLPGTDDSVTRDLLIAFHREIASGLAAAEALQRVQRSAIEKNGRRLGAWSALVMYGSDR